MLPLWENTPANWLPTCRPLSSIVGSILIEAKTKSWPPFSRRHFKYIFLNESIWISLKISLKFVPKVPINNIPALVQIMNHRQTKKKKERSSAKPLSEPMVVNLLTHIYGSLGLNELMAANEKCMLRNMVYVNYVQQLQRSQHGGCLWLGAYLVPGHLQPSWWHRLGSTSEGCLNIWVRSWNCGCLVTWFCYQLIAKPGNKTAAVSWPHPYNVMQSAPKTFVTTRQTELVFTKMYSSKSYFIACFSKAYQRWKFPLAQSGNNTGLSLAQQKVSLDWSLSETIDWKTNTLCTCSVLILWERMSVCKMTV